MKSICVWGTSLKKIADEATVLSIAKIIREKVPNIRIILFSQYGERMTRLMADENIPLSTIRTGCLWKVIWALAKADIFVIQGGPFCEDIWQAARCSVLFLIAKVFRLPVIIYGVTAFSYKTCWGRWVFRNIFNRVDDLSVRETKALEILRELGVTRPIEVFADSRFILKASDLGHIKTVLRGEGIDFERPFICVTTRYLHVKVPLWVKKTHGYDAEKVHDANQAMAKMIAHLAESFQIIIIPMHPSYEEDEAMAYAIQKYVSKAACIKLLSRRYSAFEILGIIQASEMIVASRLGSAVFATVTGTPVMGISYEPRMMDHMHRIGLGEYVLDWRDLSDKRLLSLFEKIQLQKETIRKHLALQLPKFRDLAWANSESIMKFV